MFIVITHDIQDPTRFQQCAEDVFPLPADLYVHQFLPSPDLSLAVCLYEAPSVERLSNYLEPTLEKASTQHYFAIAEEPAIGLPKSVFSSS
jgi:hypothetical protein